jgi:hypothetical protein
LQRKGKTQPGLLTGIQILANSVCHAEGKNILNPNFSNLVCSLVGKSKKVNGGPMCTAGYRKEFIIKGDKNTLVQWLPKRSLKINIYCQITSAKKRVDEYTKVQVIWHEGETNALLARQTCIYGTKGSIFSLLDDNQNMFIYYWLGIQMHDS